MAALRDTWSRYPQDWAADRDLRLGFEGLGDEWGGPEFADHIVDLVASNLGPAVDVLELGCGGGKFSQRLAPRCGSLVCTDISPTMVEHTKASLAQRGIDGNVTYKVLNGVDFEGIPSQSVDFIFSYDVLLHVQPQNVFGYLRDAHRVLRIGGTIMVHQINLASPGGIAHFLFQWGAETWKRDFDDPRRRGHIYFMSEEQMRVLGTESGLATDRLVSDHGQFERVTGGRDLIGFFSRRASRLDDLARESVDVIRSGGSDDVYAVINGVRHAFSSATQFERDGFKWGSIRSVTAEELAALPDGGRLEPWE